MQDSSSMNSATGTAANQTSMFQTNNTAIIGSLNANWRVIVPGAVQVFDLQAYGLGL
jgi:hypothetical protein